MKENHGVSLRTLKGWLALAATAGAFAVGFATVASGATVGVVNINTASAEELQLLPGVGQQRAAAILSARKSRGGFQSAEELIQVRGIGKVMFEHMLPNVTLKGSTNARRVRRSAVKSAERD